MREVWEKKKFLQSLFKEEINRCAFWMLFIVEEAILTVGGGRSNNGNGDGDNSSDSSNRCDICALWNDDSVR